MASRLHSTCSTSLMDALLEVCTSLVCFFGIGIARFGFLHLISDAILFSFTVYGAYKKCHAVELVA